jgi:hypothetical protein
MVPALTIEALLANESKGADNEFCTPTTLGVENNLSFNTLFC